MLGEVISDLQPVSASQWATISDAMLWMWLTVALVVIAAGALLVSFAVVPSLAGFAQPPGWARLLRVVSYLAAASALFAAIVCAVLFLLNAGVAYDIYPRTWV
jgi:hypothetical protein